MGTITITTIIFILATILLYETATPIILIKDYISSFLKEESLLYQLINCTPCASFYITFFLLLIYNMIPIILINTVIITGVVMTINILLNKIDF